MGDIQKNGGGGGEGREGSEARSRQEVRNEWFFLFFTVPPGHFTEVCK